MVKKDTAERSFANIVQLPAYDRQILNTIINYFCEREVKDKNVQVPHSFWQQIAVLFYLQSQLPTEIVPQLLAQHHSSSSPTNSLASSFPSSSDTFIDPTISPDPFTTLEQIVQHQKAALTRFSNLIQDELATVFQAYAGGKKAYYVQQAKATEIAQAVQELHFSVADLTLYADVIKNQLMHYRRKLHNTIITEPETTLIEKIDPTIAALQYIVTSYFETLKSMAAFAQKGVFATPRINELAKANAQLAAALAQTEQATAYTATLAAEFAAERETRAAELAAERKARENQEDRADSYLALARGILIIINSLGNSHGKTGELEATLVDDTVLLSTLKTAVEKLIEEQKVYKQLKQFLTEISVRYDALSTAADNLTPQGIVQQLQTQLELAAYYRNQLREMLQLHPNKNKKDYTQQSGVELAESVGKLLSAAVTAATTYQSLQRTLMDILAITPHEIADNNGDKIVLERVAALLEKTSIAIERKLQWEALYKKTYDELLRYTKLVEQFITETVTTFFSSQSLAGYLSTALRQGGLCLSVAVSETTLVNAGYSETTRGKDAPGIANTTPVNNGPEYAVSIKDPVTMNLGEFRVLLPATTIAALSKVLLDAVNDSYQTAVREQTNK